MPETCELTTKNNKLQSVELDRRLSVAPMLHRTDRYCRYFLRQLSRRTLLYTEMITTGALLHNDPARFLRFDPEEHPLALQLGGSNPADLARCAKLATEWGYDEINLNVGCPSDRVQAGRFGACLMAEPALVADCVAAMRAVTHLPVTVKHRIGIDQQDSEAELHQFVQTVAAAGCSTFIVHARKAWLHGLSPKQNREIPPLRYAVVHRLKQAFPQLEIIINGGLDTLDAVTAQLNVVDGVMSGRAIYLNPWLLAEVDSRLWGDAPTGQSRQEVVEQMLPFIQQQLADGVRLKQITQHLIGLFQGQLGAKAWRRHLTEQACHPTAGIEVIQQALQFVSYPHTRNYRTR
ncbi:MAG: tRNA dihydrouridine(20/20a) synthase DusA [Pseudomonadota bacterium]